jgi:hypothetical protein
MNLDWLNAQAEQDDDYHHPAPPFFVHDPCQMLAIGDHFRMLSPKSFPTAADCKAHGL